MVESNVEIIQKDKEEAPDLNYWRSFKKLFNNSKISDAKQHEFGEGVKGNFEPSKLS